MGGITMKSRGLTVLIFSLGGILGAFVIGIWLIYGGGSSVATPAERLEKEDRSVKGTAEEMADTGSMLWQGTGPMSLGSFPGQVIYDEEKELYLLELRGARFPFKASPIKAQTVPLEAEGKNALEKNTSLLYGILGEDVMYTTLLINPDEEAEVMPAAADIARYIQMVNPSKFNGIAYTKSGGKLEKTVSKGSQIQSLKEDAKSGTPVIQIKGPKSGAEKTQVEVTDDGNVIVEGKAYEELYKAADLLCITLLKMLCGNSDCPDATACASGGSCGCG
jgi:hypothetical protein